MIITDDINPGKIKDGLIPAFEQRSKREMNSMIK